jgi:hypothetical protein
MKQSLHQVQNVPSNLGMLFVILAEFLYLGQSILAKRFHFFFLLSALRRGKYVRGFFRFPVVFVGDFFLKLF